MTHPTIDCERFNEQLADFLERAVSEPMRGAIESHAVSCEECGPLLADLRRLRIDAANLPELAPSGDLWSAIESRIEAPVLSLPGARGVRSRRWTSPVVLGLAAAGLVAITATVTHWVEAGKPGVGTPGAAQRSVPTQTPPALAAVPDSAVSASRSPAGIPVSRSPGLPVPRSADQPARLVSNKPSAEQTYDREIARLLVVYNQRRPQLDSTTVAVVKKNLKIIDEAIAQTKVALRRDPASQYLMESLNDAFDSKVQLLRKVAMLPSGT